MPDKTSTGIDLRLGPLAYDHSYGQFYASWTKKNVNISVSFSATSEHDLYLTVEIVSNDCTTCELELFPRYPWKRMGEITSTETSIVFKAYNMRTTTLNTIPNGYNEVSK